MIEEMRFEKMEKAKLYFWYGLSVVLGILFCAGYYWIMVSIEVVTKLQAGIVCLLTLWSIATVVIVAAIIMAVAKEKMEENSSTFRFNAKVDELQRHLENGPIMARAQIKLKASGNFRKNFLRHENCIYYVKEFSPGTLYVWRNKDGEEKWGDECNYGFFFEYFEPVYEFKKEEA